jgi:hypothetical protein
MTLPASSPYRLDANPMTPRGRLASSTAMPSTRGVFHADLRGPMRLDPYASEYLEETLNG